MDQVLIDRFSQHALAYTRSQVQFSQYTFAHQPQRYRSSPRLTPFHQIKLLTPKTTIFLAASAAALFSFFCSSLVPALLFAALYWLLWSQQQFLDLADKQWSTLCCLQEVLKQFRLQQSIAARPLRQGKSACLILCQVDLRKLILQSLQDVIAMHCSAIYREQFYKLKSEFDFPSAFQLEQAIRLLRQARKVNICRLREEGGDSWRGVLLRKRLERLMHKQWKLDKRLRYYIAVLRKRDQKNSQLYSQNSQCFRLGRTALVLLRAIYLDSTAFEQHYKAQLALILREMLSQLQIKQKANCKEQKKQVQFLLERNQQLEQLQVQNLAPPLQDFIKVYDMGEQFPGYPDRPSKHPLALQLRQVMANRSKPQLQVVQVAGVKPAEEQKRWTGGGIPMGLLSELKLEGHYLSRSCQLSQLS